MISQSKSKKWYVYLVKCSDDTLYCGITTDIKRRISEHNGNKKGAKYTRSRRPVTLVGFLVKDTRSSAASLEYQIKKMKKEQKILMFSK